MSIFEDPIEIHYNSENRISGDVSIDTIKRALRKVSSDVRNVAIIMDHNSIRELSDQVDVAVPRCGIMDEHVSNTRLIEEALGHCSMVFGIDSGEPMCLVMDPSAVRYSNSIMDQKKVVAIEFEVEE
jgi:hypothetical protein